MRKLSWILFVLLFPILSKAQQENHSSSTPYGFSAALDQILSRSLEISLSEQSFEMVSAKNIPSRYTFFPTLSLSATLPMSKNFQNPPQSVQITSSWNLFKWGADYSGLMAARAAEESERFAVDSTVITAEQSAVSALITQIQRIKEVKIYSEMVKSQSELLDLAQERYLRGLLPHQEVQKVRVDLAHAKANLADSKIHEASARAQLESLLGQSHVSEEWPWILEFKRGCGKKLMSEDLELSKRPDWISAQRDLESQTHRVSQNWRLLLPSIDSHFSYGKYSGFFGSYSGWVGMVTLTVPLFDGLTNYSSAKAQAYVRSASETRVEKVQRDAKSQWQASQVNFQTAFDTAFAREETLEISKKLYADNLRRFESGRISANELSIDRARMNTAELLAVQGWAALHIQFASLCHSLGYRVSSCLLK